jgi:hypothetical protein
MNIMIHILQIILSTTLPCIVPSLILIAPTAEAIQVGSDARMLHKKQQSEQIAQMSSDRSSRRIYGTMKGHKRFFSAEDDSTLRSIKVACPQISWSEVSERMRGFSARQLRERWCNYLSPSLNVNAWTAEDDQELLRLHAQLGPSWGVIGTRMGNRSAPDIKNRFHLLHRSGVLHVRAPLSSLVTIVQPPVLHFEQPPPSPLDMPPFIPHPPQGAPAKADPKKKKQESPPTDFSIKSILA